MATNWTCWRRASSISDKLHLKPRSLPFERRLNISSTRYTFDIPVPWRRSCNRSTWRCARKRLASRRMCYGRRGQTSFPSILKLKWWWLGSTINISSTRDSPPNFKVTYRWMASLHDVSRGASRHVGSSFSAGKTEYRRTRWTLRCNTTSMFPPFSVLSACNPQADTCSCNLATNRFADTESDYVRLRWKKLQDINSLHRISKRWILFETDCNKLTCAGGRKACDSPSSAVLKIYRSMHKIYKVLK